MRKPQVCPLHPTLDSITHMEQSPAAKMADAELKRHVLARMGMKSKL
jgi:hypothetical protein